MLNGDKPLLSAAWIGSSIGAVDMGLYQLSDMGLALTDTISQLPSEALLGPGLSEIAVAGYVVAGGAAILNDLGLTDGLTSGV